MKLGHKPVRKCRRCQLNLGDHCWFYACPRLQWSARKCPGFENEELERKFREWQETPQVKSRRQLRQEIFRSFKQSRKLNYRCKRNAKRIQK